MIVLVYAEKGDDISSRSDTVPERETDGRTERKAELISISPVNFAVLTRDNDSHCSSMISYSSTIASWLYPIFSEMVELERLAIVEMTLIVYQGHRWHCSVDHIIP